MHGNRGELQVPSTREPGKYLGLPTVWGRKEKEALGYLKTRIWDKISGWRVKALNQAGTEVLIKSLITATPAYVMSTFKLPKAWCTEINALIADFWWEQIIMERKIHWRR